MAEHIDYIETTFEEIKQKTKGTEWEGSRVYTYLHEDTAAPMVEYQWAKELKLKNCGRSFKGI